MTISDSPLSSCYLPASLLLASRPQLQSPPPAYSPARGRDVALSRYPVDIDSDIEAARSSKTEELDSTHKDNCLTFFLRFSIYSIGTCCAGICAIGSGGVLKYGPKLFCETRPQHLKELIKPWQMATSAFVLLWLGFGMGETFRLLFGRSKWGRVLHAVVVALLIAFCTGMTSLAYQHPDCNAPIHWQPSTLRHGGPVAMHGDGV